MKIYEVFARKRCWACLWFICFSRNNFDVFRLVFQGLSAGKPPIRPGIQTCWSTQSSWHTPHRLIRSSKKNPHSFQLPKQCLALSPKRLPGFWRPSVDRFGSELVSWCKILFFPLFPIGVFRGGRQWLQLRVIVSEDASCESQSRTNSEPAVIHLRFGSWARPEGHLWHSNSNLNITRCWRNQLAPAKSTDAAVAATMSEMNFRVTWVGPCLAILSGIADITATAEKNVPWRTYGAEHWYLLITHEWWLLS